MPEGAARVCDAGGCALNLVRRGGEGETTGSVIECA